MNYTFSSSGTYTIELTVFDGANHTGSDVIVVNVYEGESPDQGGIDTALIIGAIAIAMAVILFFILLKKKKGKSAIPENGDC